MTRRMVVALLASLLLASPLQAQTVMDRLLQQVASLANAKCWDLVSLAVQVNGRPFCQNTRGSTGYFDQGQQQRYQALKALGRSLGMLYARDTRQQRFLEHRNRLERLARTLNAGVLDGVRVPSEMLRVQQRTSSIARVQYRLSTATTVLLGAPAGVVTPVEWTNDDRFRAALTARTFAAANASDQQAVAALAQTASRAASLVNGEAQGAEAARLGVEGIALVNSVQGSAAVSRALQQQLVTFDALQAERRHLLSLYARQHPGVRP